MVRRSIVVLMLCLGTLFAMSASAWADTGDIVEKQNEPPTNADGWQAGTCFANEPVAGVKCGPNTGAAFFKQAGGHPPIGFTQYIIQHEPITEAPLELANGTQVPVETKVTSIKEPVEDRDIKTLRVDLPPGETVNPNALPKCPVATFEAGGCPEASQTGEEEVTVITTVPHAVHVPGTTEPELFLPKGAIVPPTPGLTKVPVYNLEPRPGEPALFGFIAAGKKVFLETEVAWESDFHESFRIKLEPSAPPFETLISRLVSFGDNKTGNGTYINNPTTCEDPNTFPDLYSTWFRAESYGEPNPTFPLGSTALEAKVEETNGGTGTLVQQTGCDKVPFTPGVKTTPGTGAIDSPAPATVETTLKYLTGDESAVQESHLKKAVLTLPAGMGLNPSGANGLVACTDAQFKKGQRVETNECPPDSRVGSVEIDSPPLSKTLTGQVYVGEPKSTNPESGEEFRILLEAKDEKQGIDVRLVGNVKANATTGQLTAVFNEKEIGEFAGALPEGLPQVPFTSVRVKFDGPRSVLTSPPTCAAAETTGQMEPWARPGTTTPVSDKFNLTGDPGGGACPTTLAGRKFAPGYSAKVDNSTAGAYSPFRVAITRPDGQQELKVVNVTLPKGLTGKLAGVPYCSDAAIAAAAAATGKAEQVSPSCPTASRIGGVQTISGTGANPLRLPGSAYLAGPYKGAPISLVTIVPAVAGPYDLGTVVVRVALNVNPETAQINAVSDLIPDVFGGVKLDIRSILVNVDKPAFMKNPTNCASQATTGTINGGGADPANPAAFSTYAVTSPFAAVNCNALKFKPKFVAQIFGPTKRAKFPRIKVTVKAKEGEANFERTALTLPHSLFLEQSHIRTVCTRVQLAAAACPKGSVYGHAEAITPLLDGKLKGPVYLVSSTHKLPDLLVNLRGQIPIRLRGVISSKNGGLKTVFNGLPDVPVKKFVLNMSGGKKSLLVNSTNTCQKPQRAVLKQKGQNGKKANNNKFKLNVVSCKGKKKGKK